MTANSAASEDAPRRAAIIGGGPAGLMAAEVLAAAGLQVDLYDTMPSVGRKFLLAGKGGLNLTHGEPMVAFLERYGAQRERLAPLLARFGPDALRAWASDLGIKTFVGSSGRVFPADLKAAPLLRAWLHRLRAAGVRLHMRHRWVGWCGSGATALRLQAPQGEVDIAPDAVLLALGGASWPQLGSDGAWQALLQQRGVELAPLQPSNCGFDVQRRQANGQVLPGWSEHFRSRHAGQPLKNVALSLLGSGGRQFASPGEFVVTETGVEGSLVYAASSVVR
ncbi:MAG: TIGR03862 family flavoprotein, partial [Rhizobacter sp.]|nr:TIGR03862 family flavoprotein [Rhizobacter sp.]